MLLDVLGYILMGLFIVLGIAFLVWGLIVIIALYTAIMGAIIEDLKSLARLFKK
ncbi:hypothetical protein BPO_0454 [Bergeyella porcorum]|uniref:Uncharacterized protein n=1 Tax=Bergeyella porcorum TaxID=1735111 RepID=A0AAU0F0M5_9FLAO